MRQQRAAIAVVGQQARQSEQRAAGCFQQQAQGVAENVLQPWAPGVAPNVLEGGDQMRGDQRATVRVNGGEGIEADGMRQVGGVEIDHVVGAPTRYDVRDRHGQVAMRIQQGKAVTAVEIGQHHVGEQRRLPRPGLADQVQVAAAIAVRQQRRQSRRIRAEFNMCLVVAHGSPSEPKRHPQWVGQVVARACVRSGQAGGGRRPLNAAGGWFPFVYCSSCFTSARSSPVHCDNQADRCKAKANRQVERGRVRPPCRHGTWSLPLQQVTTMHDQSKSGPTPVLRQRGQAARSCPFAWPRDQEHVRELL